MFERCGVDEGHTRNERGLMPSCLLEETTPPVEYFWPKEKKKQGFMIFD